MSDLFSQPIVSNTGPLLGLSRIGQLGLVIRMFPEVIIPREVMEELLLTPHADVDELRQQLLGYTVSMTSSQADPLLLAQLDPGEAAVISLASQRGLPVLMDERKGRRVASLIYQLPVIGTGGLLVAAKRRGLIRAVRPMLEQMQAGGYFLGPSLVAECLRRAGE
jgi:predicted nucleic acid-binding protein